MLHALIFDFLDLRTGQLDPAQKPIDESWVTAMPAGLQAAAARRCRNCHNAASPSPVPRIVTLDGSGIAVGGTRAKLTPINLRSS